MKPLKIGQVARASGVSVETVRYYERERLLGAPDRRASGYRQYDDDAIARLRFIKQTKELGFTLGEIRELLRLRFDAETRCEHVRELAEKKISEIEEKLAALQTMRRSLKKMLRECESRASKADCPLMNGLGEPSARPTSHRRRDQ